MTATHLRMASIYLQKIPGNAASRWVNRLQLGALVLVAGLVSGCASIFGSETENLPITSQPSDAQILITDEAGYTVFRGRTPDRVPLPKSDGRYFGGKTFSIAISKKGYLTQRVKIDAQPNALYLGGNILAGGVVGWLMIDPTNGKMYELSKAGVDVKLQQLPDAAGVAAASAGPAAATSSATPPAASSSTTDLRPPAPAAATIAIPVAAPAEVPTAAPLATPAATAVVANPPAPPSIFVPERPPETAAATPPINAKAEPAPELLPPLPATPDSTAPQATPSPAESRPPPPYWPAPPKLPVSPSTRAPGSLLLAGR